MKVEYNNFYTNFVFKTLNRISKILEEFLSRIEKYINNEVIRYDGGGNLYVATEVVQLLKLGVNEVLKVVQVFKLGVNEVFNMSSKPNFQLIPKHNNLSSALMCYTEVIT